MERWPLHVFLTPMEKNGWACVKGESAPSPAGGGGGVRGKQVTEPVSDLSGATLAALQALFGDLPGSFWKSEFSGPCLW